MAKSKIYNLDDGGGHAPAEREPLTFADLEVGDVFRFATWDANHPCDVSAIKWKVSDKMFALLTMATSATATAETVLVTVVETAAAVEVVRYDLGLKLSNPQRYKEDQKWAATSTTAATAKS
jgi:stalled ribosome rescue protein Dom34